MLRVLHGEVLSKTFVDHVCRLAFESRNTSDDRRPALEAERDELKGDLENLKAALRKAKSEEARDLLMEDFEPAAKRLKSVEQQLAILTEPADSATLRAALEQRIKNWREVLRSKHKDECRFIINRLLGSVTFYADELSQLETADGFDENDRRGKDNLSLSDCGWTGSVNPAGFLDLFHNRLASPMPASWNQIVSWLRQIDALQAA